MPRDFVTTPFKGSEVNLYPKSFLVTVPRVRVIPSEVVSIGSDRLP